MLTNLENLKTFYGVTQETIDQFLLDVFQNYPEAGIGMALQCNGWKYPDNQPDKLKLLFIDTEDDKRYTLTIETARKGLDLYVEDAIKRHKEGNNNNNDYYSLDNLLDPCEWDAIRLDILTQFALLGEAIYG